MVALLLGGLPALDDVHRPCGGGNRFPKCVVPSDCVTCTPGAARAQCTQEALDAGLVEWRCFDATDNASLCKPASAGVRPEQGCNMLGGLGPAVLLAGWALSRRRTSRPPPPSPR